MTDYRWSGSQLTHTCVCACVHAGRCVCVFVCVYVCAGVCVCVCVCMRVHTYVWGRGSIPIMVASQLENCMLILLLFSMQLTQCTLKCQNPSFSDLQLQPSWLLCRHVFRDRAAMPFSRPHTKERKGSGYVRLAFTLTARYFRGACTITK